MGKKILSILIIIIVMMFATVFSVSAVTTSIDYRYDSEYNEVRSKYMNLSSLDSKGTYVIPGLESTDVLGEVCDCMVPQGICSFGNYLLVTAYCGVDVYAESLQKAIGSGTNAEKLESLSDHSSTGIHHPSVIYVLSKSTGQYLKTLVLSDDNHVGGIAFDGTYIWVAKSGDKQLSAVLPSDITTALSSSENSVKVEYYANIYCDRTASFVTTYNNMLWVGVFNTDVSGTLCGYSVSGNTPETLELIPEKELVIPEKANGAALVKIGDETCLAVNSSYGRNNDTVVHLYSVDLQENSNAGSYTVHAALTLPPMAEDICIDGNTVYTLFESASTPYSCADGNKCNNIVDRIITASLDDWFYWTDGDYTEPEIEVKPDDGENSLVYEPTNEADARYVPTYVKQGNGVQMLYNPYTAEFALDLSVNAYKIGVDDSWYNTLSKHGYTQFKRIENGAYYSIGSKKDTEGNEEKLLSGLNGAVAIKKLYYNGAIKYAVAVAFRGTNFKDIADVITDISIIPDSDGLHSGFSNAAKDFYDICRNASFTVEGQKITIAEIIEDMKNTDSKFCMLVTGHSLGAAVADIFAGHILTEQQGVYPGNVVAYTFAAPWHAKSSYTYSANNIYNIVNTDDIVTCISFSGEKRIGYDIKYSPDDIFREKYYGSNYSPGHDTLWWITDINAVSTGFVAHDSNNVYRAIINCKDEDIAEFAYYNTRTDNRWSNHIFIDKSCFGKIGGNLSVKYLNFDGGVLEIAGNCSIGNYGGFTMNKAEDYLLVHGDFLTYDSGSSLTAGTVEIKGDFVQCGDTPLYNESDTHRTILSGDKKQTVSFKYPSENNKFQNLILENTDIYFATEIYQLKLPCNFNHNGDLAMVNLEQNGYNLTVNGNLSANKVSLDGGKLKITGNFSSQKEHTTTGGGDFEIGGNAEFRSVDISGQANKIGGNLSVKYLNFDGGVLEIAGNCSIGNYGGFTMNKAEDYLLVHGDFLTYDSGSSLTAGIVEIKGDFVQRGGSSYNERDTHRTILSGDKKQTVSFESPGDSNKFQNLILQNESEDGTVFNSRILVYGLFSHSVNNFTLYENGKDSIFQDYDKDGTLDPFDPFPADEEIEISALTVAEIEDVVYNSSFAEPEVMVYYKSFPLKKDVDYKLQYFNNTKVGTAYVMVTGIGNIAGCMTKEFNITCGENHIYQINITAATCTNIGTKIYTCSCGDTYTETIAKLGHNYSSSYTVDKKATCTAAGSKSKYCTRSGCTAKTSVTTITKLAHTYTTTTTNATLSANGSIKTTCTVCGNVKSNNAISYPKTFTLSTTSYTYNGYAKKPTVTVKDAAGNTLVNGTDYTVTYASGRVAVGTYKVTVTMKGNYSGTKTLSFKIVPMDISKCTVSLSATSYTYNGYIKTPTVTVKNSNGATLTKDTHYTVTYASGRKAPGAYKVTVKMKGNYTGEKTLSFKINPIDISTCTVKLSATSYTYNGSVKTPTVTVTNAYGQKLTKDTHYTVTYSAGRKAPGTYNVTVKMKGNYTGTKTLSFKIKPIDISTCTVKLSATSYTFNGYVKTPTVTVTNSYGTKLTKDKHYTVTYATGRKDAGTYNVTVKMIGNYTGEKTLTFKIKPIDISICTVKLSATSLTYNGKVRTPVVTVTNSYGTKLTKGTHYAVTYQTGRKSVGTYKVTVKMIGNYTGTKTLTFKINPIKISTCTVNLSATSLTYNGEIRTPDVSVTNSYGQKLTFGTHYSVIYSSGRKNVGTYNVTVKMKGNYTGSKTLTFKINPPKTTVASLVRGTKAITVNVSKQAVQTTGYQIQYATNKSFTNAKTVTIANNTTLKATLRNLNAATTYYVRVRTYKTVSNATYYSDWSAYKYVKTK